MTRLRIALVDAWYRGAAWLWLLRPFEVVFRVLAAARRGLYRRGLLSVYRAPVPVVVVGNITVGGTGKTPVVIALAEAMHERGIKVGVISRGYGARGISMPRRVDSGSTAEQCGDEALLIQRRTGCPCVVAPSRSDAARTLVADSSVELIISDDGLQHYALERDMEVAIVDQQRGIGNGFCLPAGPLREPALRLRSVDHVVYRGGPQPAKSVCYQPVCLVHLGSGRHCAAEPAALGREIHAVAGIGQPGQFFDSLRELGFEASLHVFDDHHCYRAADFDGLKERPIIMTEKDAVKCAGLAGENAWYLKIDALLPPTLTDAVAALARPEMPWPAT